VGAPLGDLPSVTGSEIFIFQLVPLFEGARRGLSPGSLLGHPIDHVHPEQGGIDAVLYFLFKELLRDIEPVQDKNYQVRAQGK